MENLGTTSAISTASVLLLLKAPEEGSSSHRHSPTPCTQLGTGYRSRLPLVLSVSSLPPHHHPEMQVGPQGPVWEGIDFMFHIRFLAIVFHEGKETTANQQRAMI